MWADSSDSTKPLWEELSDLLITILVPGRIVSRDHGRTNVRATNSGHYQERMRQIWQNPGSSAELPFCSNAAAGSTMF